MLFLRRRSIHYITKNQTYFSFDDWYSQIINDLEIYVIHCNLISLQMHSYPICLWKGDSLQSPTSQSFIIQSHGLYILSMKQCCMHFLWQLTIIITSCHHIRCIEDTTLQPYSQTCDQAWPWGSQSRFGAYYWKNHCSCLLSNLG